jgi:hypothetical protein
LEPGRVDIEHHTGGEREPSVTQGFIKTYLVADKGIWQNFNLQREAPF